MRKGILISPNSTFHGRYNVVAYNKTGHEVIKWIRDPFGDDDDMVYASSEIDGINFEEFYSLITEEQLFLLELKFP